MKKMKTARAAVTMVIAALLTTCLIGGTFAKYVSSASGDTKARIAYWGFGDVATLDFTDLFADSYDNVNSDMGDNVIAPGTSGSVEFILDYNESASSAPEVAYNYTVNAEGVCPTDIKENGMIQFKLDDGEYGTFDELIASLKLLSGDASGTKRYEPHTKPESVKAAMNSGKHKISWKWAFTDPANETRQDQVDTQLGAESDMTCTLSLTITAEQID